MIIFQTVALMRNWLKETAVSPEKIGFVPTMGALHGGHISLIASSLQRGCTTVCSIFVNPTQFNNTADFDRYPSTLEQDVALLEAAGCHALLLPTVEDVYPEGTQSLPHYPMGALETRLEGQHRPGHFQGVCQVMHRLLTAVEPGHLFMGKKDYQQCMVVQWLLRHEQIPTQLHAQPTVREPNGLAMSSRNMRLDTEQLAKSTTIYAQLQWMKSQLAELPFGQITKQATTALLNAGFASVDYVAIADAYTLEPITKYCATQQSVGLIAASMGAVRLIDNLELREEPNIT